MSHDHADHRRACELHALTHCGICHRDAGQCSYGSCQKSATHRATHETGRDVRELCKLHATADRYAFCRAGFSVVSLNETVK